MIPTDLCVHTLMTHLIIQFQHQPSRYSAKKTATSKLSRTNHHDLTIIWTKPRSI